MKKFATFIFVAIIVVTSSIYLVLFAKYANTPIGEMPTWVYYLLFNNGK